MMNKQKRLLSLLLVVVMLFSSWVIPNEKAYAGVALPSISSSKYISTYTYASSGKAYAYKEAGLKNKTGGYIACATDECRILEIKGQAVRVSYPVSGGRKTAWFSREAFTYRDLASYGAKMKFKCTKKVTTYKWKNKGNTFGYISSGDTCYLVRGDSSSDWLQVIYPVSSGYKMGWVKGSDIIPVIWPVTTKITLNTSSVTLNGIGSTTTLRATVTPSNSSQGVSWTSSNNGVATVSGGTVKAVGAGNATITATSGSKSVSASVKVVVDTQPVIVTVVHPTGVSLNKTSASLYVGKSLTLNATVKPSNATNKDVIWSSSNTSIASVNASGKVTAKKAGKTTITVATKDGGHKASATITVKKADNKLYFPLKGKIVRSSNCKTNKQYCDYKAAQGTPVYAPADGKVVFRQTYSTKYKKLVSYGNSIYFTSSDGKYTVLCAHLKKFNGVPLTYTKSMSYPCPYNKKNCKTINLKTKKVKKGELLGYVGHTGNASGAHLHIEVKKEGVAKSPANVFTTW